MTNNENACNMQRFKNVIDFQHSIGVISFNSKHSISIIGSKSKHTVVMGSNSEYSVGVIGQTPMTRIECFELGMLRVGNASS